MNGKGSTAVPSEFESYNANLILQVFGWETNSSCPKDAVITIGKHFIFVRKNK